MKKINSLLELREERKRLHLKAHALEGSIKIQVQAIREELQPAHMVLSEIKKIMSGSTNPQNIFNYAIGNLTQHLLDNFVLRNSGFITKIVGGFIAKNATNNLVNNFIASKKEAVLNWVSSLMHKHKKNGTEAHEDEV